MSRSTARSRQSGLRRCTAARSNAAVFVRSSCHRPSSQRRRCEAALAPWHASAAQWLWLGSACAASLLLYVLRGWQLSGMGALGLVDLARAPFFLAWKVLLLLRSRGSLTWVRTTRRLQ